MATSATPEAGAIEDGVHRLALRVYYEDTDAGGIVYHANYLKFAERARTEMLRCLGLDHVALRARHGVTFTVHRLSADFLAPARLDDRLVVATRLLRRERATLELEQRVAAADGRLLARLEVRLALLTADLRVARPPPELRRALAPMRASGDGA
jgi:acyl-CoA thioester hydrolase